MSATANRPPPEGAGLVDVPLSAAAAAAKKKRLNCPCPQTGVGRLEGVQGAGSRPMTSQVEVNCSTEGVLVQLRTSNPVTDTVVRYYLTGPAQRVCCAASKWVKLRVVTNNIAVMASQVTATLLVDLVGEKVVVPLDCGRANWVTGSSFSPGNFSPGNGSNRKLCPGNGFNRKLVLEMVSTGNLSWKWK